MVVELELRLLVEGDDRSAFHSGQPELDRYFHHYAGQNQFKLGLSVNLVAVWKARLVGYATITAGTIERARGPEAKARKRLPSYPLPVLRLARLAVSLDAQGQGVGRALLRRTLEAALAQRDALGCVGVVTDAKPGAVEFYARYGFSPLDGVREGALVGEPQPMFLPLSALTSSSPGP